MQLNELCWVIQSNLGSSKEIKYLIKACRKLSIEVLPVHVIPFSEELPDIPTEKNAIFYGSATFIANAQKAGKWFPCAFFDDDVFRFSNWSRKYGSSILNNDARIYPMKDFAKCNFVGERDFFIRPDRDLKEFSGQIMSFRDYLEWFSKIDRKDLEMTVGPDTDIVVASPKPIEHEWRLFMIEKCFCSGSHYRSNGELDIFPEVPIEIQKFAENEAAKWYPNLAYVLDIALSEGAPSIVELNGFNSAGFYASDIEKIVKDISEKIIEGRIYC